MDGRKDKGDKAIPWHKNAQGLSGQTLGYDDMQGE